MKWDEMMHLFDLNTLLNTAVYVGVAIMVAAEKFLPEGKRPWSAIARALGRELNHGTIERVGGVEKRLAMLTEKVDKVAAKNEENQAKTVRARILRFGDEMLEGRHHSKDSFDQVVMDINEYDRYCAEHPDFKNHITNMTAEMIKNQYQECMRKRSFAVGKKKEEEE
nr:MAG TPA: hypothetical protein [Caudoviricetes sp.]